VPPAERHDDGSSTCWTRRTGILLAISLVALVVALKSHEGTSTAKAPRAHGALAAHSTAGAQAGQVAATHSDPLAAASMRRFLSTRTGSVSIAVQDLGTGHEWLENPSARDQAASIMKVDILETLLRQSEVNGTPLDDDWSSVQGMIENSDNDDAQDLWDDAGGSTGVGAYNADAGLTHTDLNTDGYWGESTTSAADQILLLDELVAPHGLLDPTSETSELGLMENVEADQTWGVSGGVPAGVSVALKNGWVPLTSNTDWEVNSIGRVQGAGRDYLIAVLTAHDPSEAYGIDTIDGVSALVWRGL
jgi:beta-lactamase class A